MKKIGVPISFQNKLAADIQKDSDRAKLEQIREFRKLNWTLTDLNIYTSEQTLNAVHTAVTNGKPYYQKFMHWKVPFGMTARLVADYPLHWKMYSATGEELGRDVELILSLGKIGKHLPTEIAAFNYSPYYDIAWTDQLDKDNRDSLIMSLGVYTEVLFHEGEEIQLWIKNSTIDLPSTPHTNSLIAYPCQTIINAEVKRHLARIRAEAEAESK